MGKVVGGIDRNKGRFISLHISLVPRLRNASGTTFNTPWLLSISHLLPALEAFQNVSQDPFDASLASFRNRPNVFQRVLVQSLDLGPILQASDSLSPRVPGSARRPFLKFAPEPIERSQR